MEAAIQLQHIRDILLSAALERQQDLDPPTESELVSTRAYLLLAHSTIEEFLEDTFYRHFKAMVGSSDDPEVIPQMSGRMFFFWGKRLSEKDKLKIPNNASLRHISNVAEGYVLREIASNNGIKGTNLENLARAVGLDWDLVESTLPGGVASLNTLGSKRGEAGHLSPFTDRGISITELTTAKEAATWVDDAWNCARAISERLRELRAAQFGRPASIIIDWDGN